MDCIHIETPLKDNTTFKIGDRVQRLEDVHDQGSRLMTGTVVRVYRLEGCKYGPYEEMYDVMWDATYRQGYLPHGLEILK